MFSLKNKLNPELKNEMISKHYKSYRVIIHCRALIEKVAAKINSYKGEVIYSITSINCICAHISDRGLERLLEFPEIDYITFDSFAHLCGKSVLSANGVNFQENINLLEKELELVL